MMQSTTVNDTSPTLADVSRLIASVEDSGHWSLIIRKDGIPELRPTRTGMTEDIHVRFQSFHKGNGYVGTEAAQDKAWVERVHRALLANWPNPVHGNRDQQTV